MTPASGLPNASRPSCRSARARPVVAYSVTGAHRSPRAGRDRYRRRPGSRPVDRARVREGRGGRRDQRRPESGGGRRRRRARPATLPGSIHAVQADVTVAADVDRLVERALAVRGRIDVLVNNAARGMRFVNEQFMTDPQPFWEADPESWRLVIETNIIGVFLMSPRGRAAHARRRARKHHQRDGQRADDDAPWLLALRAVEGRARGDDPRVGRRARGERRRHQPAGAGRRHRYREWCRSRARTGSSCSTRTSSCRRRCTSRSRRTAASGSSPPSGAIAAERSSESGRPPGIRPGPECSRSRVVPVRRR